MAPCWMSAAPADESAAARVPCRARPSACGSQRPDTGTSRNCASDTRLCGSAAHQSLAEAGLDLGIGNVRLLRGEKGLKDVALNDCVLRETREHA